MMAKCFSVGVLLLFATSAVCAQGDAFFENQVRPILVKHCQNCHGPRKQSGGLRLDSREAAIRGGDRGPALVSGQADKSLLIQAVSHKVDLRMPPKSKLSGPDVAVWYYAPVRCRSAQRSEFVPGYRDHYYGVRHCFSVE